MKKISLRSSIQFFLFFLIILLGNSAFAFLPESTSLIKFMLEKKGRYYNYMEVPYGEQLYTEDEKSVAMDMNLYYSSSGVFKANIFFNGHKKIYMESLTQSISVQDGLLLSEGRPDYFMFKDILWMNDHELLKGLLDKRGCLLDHVRLDRDNDMVFFVIGELSKDKEKSAELWIDKESFLPYKYVVIKNSEKFSFVYGQWFKTKALKYPGVVNIFYGDNKIRTLKAHKVNMNFNPDRSFFNIDEFISSFKKDGHNGGGEKDDPLNAPLNTIDKIFQ